MVYLDSFCHVLSKILVSFDSSEVQTFELMTSLWRHLANLHKLLYSFENTIRSYLRMPNFKSISFEMTELWGRGGRI